MSLIWQEIFIKPIFNLLIFFYNVIPGHDLGVAIILSSVALRLVLFPSSLSILRHQIALQKLKPEMDKIKKQYKDKKEQSQALVKLYQENKVNPFSSCLLTIFQLFFLIALFVVLRSHLPAKNYSLLYPFIHSPHSLNPYFLGQLNLINIPKITSLASLAFYKWHVLLALLTGLSQFYQSKMLLPKGEIKDKSTALSKQMTYFFPALIVFFSLSLPAGLPLSWLITTIFAIATQIIVFKEEKDVGAPT